MRKLGCLLIISFLFILSVKGLTQSGSLKQHSSQSDKEKVRKQVEELADRFIQRWHETLDLKILAKEMFVSSPEFKHINEKLFYVWCVLMTAPDGDEETTRPELEKDIDETAMKECFIAYTNMMMVAFEYGLAFEKPEDSEGIQEEPPKEIISEMEKLTNLRLSSEKIDLISIKKVTTQADRISGFFRKYLPREIFDSNRYKANVRKQEIQEEEDRLYAKRAAKEIGEDYSDDPFEILHKLEKFGIEISNDLEIYSLRRGQWTFLFVEEKGQLKILSVN